MKSVFFAAVLAVVISLDAQAANRFLFLSDSMFTQAYGTVRPSKMAFNIVNAKINGVVTVFGSPGATIGPQGGHVSASEMLDAVEFYKGRFNASGVFIQISTNDHTLSVPMEAYKASLRTLVSGIQAKGLGVICLKPFWKINQTWVNNAGHNLADYQQAMTEVCSQYSATTLTFNATSADFVDGIHLNEAGHAKFAEWFINVGVFLGGWEKIATTTLKTATAKVRQ